MQNLTQMREIIISMLNILNPIMTMSGAFLLLTSILGFVMSIKNDNADSNFVPRMFMSILIITMPKIASFVININTNIETSTAPVQSNISLEEFTQELFKIGPIILIVILVIVAIGIALNYFEKKEEDEKKLQDILDTDLEDLVAKELEKLDSEEEFKESVNNLDKDVQNLMAKYDNNEYTVEQALAFFNENKFTSLDKTLLLTKKYLKNCWDEGTLLNRVSKPKTIKKAIKNSSLDDENNIEILQEGLTIVIAAMDKDKIECKNGTPKWLITDNSKKSVSVYYI